MHSLTAVKCQVRLGDRAKILVVQYLLNITHLVEVCGGIWETCMFIKHVIIFYNMRNGLDILYSRSDFKASCPYCCELLSFYLYKLKSWYTLKVQSAVSRRRRHLSLCMVSVSCEEIHFIHGDHLRKWVEKFSVAKYNFNLKREIFLRSTCQKSNVLNVYVTVIPWYNFDNYPLSQIYRNIMIVLAMHGEVN